MVGNQPQNRCTVAYTFGAREHANLDQLRELLNPYFNIKTVYTDGNPDYHGVNDGYCSWCDFAKAIFAKFNLDIKVLSISSGEFKTKAKRPHNSRLSKANTEKIGLDKMAHWDDALARYVVELKGLSYHL